MAEGFDSFGKEAQITGVQSDCAAEVVSQGATDAVNDFYLREDDSLPLPLRGILPS